MEEGNNKESFGQKAKNIGVIVTKIFAGVATKADWIQLIKFALPFIIAVVLMSIIGFMMIIALILGPIEYAQTGVDNAKKGVASWFEKLGNWFSGNGFTDSETAYMNIITENQGSLGCENASLVTATIMYYYQYFNEDMDWGSDTDAIDETITNDDSTTETVEINYGKILPDLKRLTKKIKSGKDKYENYVKNTFLEKEPYNKLLQGYENDLETRKNEIYEEIKLIADALPCSNKISGTSVCKYDINGSEITNLKVRLLKCGHFDGDKSPVEDAELIDFEKYVLGVVSQEVPSSFSDEAIKAQAVAVRSFILTRAKSMPNSYGIGEITEIDGQQVISIRACTDDQAYCDPDRGCWSDCTGGESSACSSGNEATIHPGIITGKNWIKQPISSDSKYRTLVAATAGEVAYDSDGNIASLNFTSTDQNKWNELAKQGKSYQEILYEHYGDKINTISSDCTQGLGGNVRLPLDTYKITSAYGYRTHPVTGEKQSYHSGVDLSASIGQAVYAIAPGKVVLSEFNSSYGFYIIIAHDVDYNGEYDYYSLYAHNSKLLVAEDDYVSGGDQIAEAGSTGRSTGPHLHFEIRVGSNSRNNATDPVPYLEDIMNGTSVFNQMIVSENNRVQYFQTNYKDVAYCPGSSDNGTISNYGCLPTSYAMVVASLRDSSVTPATIANLICNDYRNYKVDGSGSNSAIFSNTDFLSKYNLTSQKITGKTVDEYAEIITSELKNNKMIIVNVLGGVYNTSNKGHYVVLAGITSDNKIIVYDPSGESLSGETDLEFIKTNMLGNIRNGIWIFS